MEHAEEDAPTCAPQRWLRQGLVGSGQEAARENLHGMAAQEACYEGVPHLWQECWAQQQLTEAPPAEGTSEDIVRECGQCNDLGDTESIRGDKGWSGRQRQPYAEITIAHRRILILHLMPFSEEIFACVSSTFLEHQDSLGMYHMC
uniref:Uncharacterized protein n=1 Tax=Arundo donax TaxID=35708 RepID=A0A0A9DI70_ARUDO